MTIIKHITAAALCCLSIGSVQAEQVLVFGLTLGGKANRNLPECSSSSALQEEFCWTQSFIRTAPKGRLLLARPPLSRVPEWVLRLPAELEFDAKTNLARIKVPAVVGNHQAVIGSISKRFGDPVAVDITEHEYQFVVWTLPALSIVYLCDRGHCLVEFKSADAVRAEEAKKAAERPRPATP